MTDDLVKRLRRGTAGDKERHAAADSIEQFEQSFDLRWSADMRAIERWRKDHPGNDLVMPDHADLCVWLLDRIKKLTAALRKIKDLHHGPEDEEVVIIRDDMTYFIVCEALGETP